MGDFTLGCCVAWRKNRTLDGDSISQAPTSAYLGRRKSPIFRLGNGLSQNVKSTQTLSSSISGGSAPVWHVFISVHLQQKDYSDIFNILWHNLVSGDRRETMNHSRQMLVTSISVLLGKILLLWTWGDAGSYIKLSSKRKDISACLPTIWESRKRNHYKLALSVSWCLRRISVQHQQGREHLLIFDISVGSRYRF